MNLLKLVLRGLIASIILVCAGLSPVQAEQTLHLDPANVKGPSACGECHENSVKAWRGSHHFSTFKAMPRSDKAREIADKLGIKRVKSESDCLSCHFTSAVEEGKVLARRYLDRLGEIIGTEVLLASVGPERSQSLVRPGSWLARQLDL